MKGEKSILEHLQTALTMELSAVNQYLLHAHVLEDWGLDRLARKMRDEMKEEQGHADRLLDRLMFLEGAPDVGKLNSIGRGNSLRGILEANLRDEMEARGYYTKAAEAAFDKGDLGTRDLFRSLIADEEGHINFLETQLNLFDLIGEAAYAQLQARHDAGS
jgi:bacterioferritin